LRIQNHDRGARVLVRPLRQAQAGGEQRSGFHVQRLDRILAVLYTPPVSACKPSTHPVRVRRIKRGTKMAAHQTSGSCTRMLRKAVDNYGRATTRCVKRALAVTVSSASLPGIPSGANIAQEIDEIESLF